MKEKYEVKLEIDNKENVLDVIIGKKILAHPEKNETICVETAKIVVGLFCGQSTPTESYTFLSREDGSDDCSNYFDWDNFYNKLDSLHLSQSANLNPVLFCFCVNETMHHFVVEKRVERDHITWHAYQSWQDAYSLSEWMGFSPWQAEDLETDTQWCKKYGQGKPLSMVESKNFVHEVLESCAMGMIIKIEIKVYPVNLSLLNEKQDKPSVLTTPICSEQIKGPGFFADNSKQIITKENQATEETSNYKFACNIL